MQAALGHEILFRRARRSALTLCGLLLVAGLLCAGCSQPVATAEKPALPEKVAETEAAVAEQTSADDETVEPTPEPPAARDPERLVLFTARGPLIVELQMFVGDQPFRTAVDKLLAAYLKKTAASEGQEPTWAEVVAKGGMSGNAAQGAMPSELRMIQQLDKNRDGRVQADELPAWLAGDVQSGRAFAAQTVTGTTNTDPRDSPLFLLLDSDHNGRLTSPELAAAPKLLRSRDADDDDVVLLADLRRLSNNNAMMRDQDEYRHDAALELREAELEAIYYQLTELYDRGDGLDAGAFSLVPSLFAALDRNGDGIVRLAEMVHLPSARSDLVLRVTFPAADAAGGPSLELVATSDELREAPQTQPQPAQIDLTVAGTTLDAYTVEGTKPSATVGEDLPNYHTVQIQVRVGQPDDALFGWLDVNHDERLTLREINDAAARLALLDTNGDGITPDELPSRMACAIVRAPTADKNLPPLPSVQRKTTDAKAPPWLTAMDLNGDGEVSAREFLGTPEQFRKLDLNGDGFLDPSEIPAPAQ